MADPTRQRLAVIDIGSNSIKLLVAERGPADHLIPIVEATDETRIGVGISHREPRLQESSMAAGIASVARLHQAAHRAGADRLLVTATSAVRDALNRDEFAARLQTRTGLTLHILSGLEEAEAIARGIRTDPALGHLTDFYLFDLGGGSLEALSIQGGTIRRMASLQLGCVRLTERFIADLEAPFTPADRARIEAHVRETLQQSAFRFDLPAAAATVMTGGTAAIAKSLATAAARDRESSCAPLTRGDLEDLLARIGPLPLVDRRKQPGLPPARADVYPVALATLIAVLDAGGIASFRHSFHNLRYGMAATRL